MYDYIISASEAFFRYGLSPTAVVMALFAFLKMRKVKKRIRRYIPWLIADDDSEIKCYVQNQARIEMKIDLLLKERDIEWSVITLEINSERSARRSVVLSELLSATSTIAPSAERFTKLRRSKVMSKFKSRKFWMAVVTAVLIVLNDGLDLGIDTETVLTFAGIVATFIIGESAVDASRKRKEPANDDDFTTPIEPRL